MHASLVNSCSSAPADKTLVVPPRGADWQLGPDDRSEDKTARDLGCPCWQTQINSTWFGTKLPLQWFTSYLSSRTSAVSIPPYLSPFEPLIFGVPQGSVLGPIHFNLYTTPSVLSLVSSSISHLLYADDTQLFISFILNKFSHCYLRLIIYHLLGCHPTTSPLILPKLNFFLLDFYN